MTTRTVLTVLVTGVALAALGNVASPTPKSGTVSTEPVALGNGTARAYVTIENGRAIALGVALSEQVVEGLPHEMLELVLPLPVDNPTPYRHVTLNWNPHGHEPLGVYDAPHFDFHFFTISDAERRQIDPADPLFATKAANYPGSAFIPKGYVAPLAYGIPLMGVHWVDPASPELNGRRFTHTFLYGSWNGRMIFAEPMVTKSFLESRADVTMDLPVATRHQAPGHYPSQYRIQFDSTANEYRVALVGLAHRN